VENSHAGLMVLIQRFLADRLATRSLAETTERQYRHHLLSFADTVGHDTPASEVTRAEVVAWLATMGHLANSSLKTASEPVRSLFAWAVLEGILETDPTAQIPRPKQAPPTYRALSPDVVARCLHVGDFRQRTMVLLVLHLGLRCCELGRATVADWDRGDGWFDVRGKGGRGRVTRRLPVAGEVEWSLAMWVDSVDPAGPLFPSMHGNHLHANSVSQIFTKLARRAGVSATAHQFRHTCAHHLIEHGSRMNAVQRVLGHASPAVTGIYTAASDEQLMGISGRTYSVGVDLSPVLRLRPAESNSRAA